MKYLTSSILNLRERKKTARKGDYGRALIVGGSEDYAGAPAMAAMAAEAVLRSGADLVTVAAPEKTAWAINSLLPDIITKKLRCRNLSQANVSAAVKLSREHDVTLIGPGMGRSKGSLSFARQASKKITGPKVIDADALKAVRIKELKNAVLTPHMKELEILLRNSRISDRHLRESLSTNVIIQKGHIDRIISKDSVALNRTGNSVMAKAGTGDVLAGLCAGFIAQTRDLFRSACMAAYLNGKTGDYLKRRFGRTFIASDITKNLHRFYF